MSSELYKIFSNELKDSNLPSLIEESVKKSIFTHRDFLKTSIQIIEKNLFLIDGDCIAGKCGDRYTIVTYSIFSEVLRNYLLVLRLIWQGKYIASYLLARKNVELVIDLMFILTSSYKKKIR